MKQITIRQLVKQSKDIEKWLPCEVLRDGEVIAILSSPHDVIQRDKPSPRRNTLSDKLTELPLSKKKQAQSTW